MVNVAYLVATIALVTLSVGSSHANLRECTADNYVSLEVCPLNEIVSLRNIHCMGGAEPPAPKKIDGACSCKDDPENIESYDSPCDHSTDPPTRTRYYYWKDLKKCVNSLPPLPIKGIPCHVVCKPGEYRDIHKHKCVQCGAGTYAVGGGDRYDRWERNDGWPSEFQLKCTQPYGTKCEGWQLSGDYIHSGNNSVALGMAEITSSVLRLRRKLVRDGKISFTFRVEAEPGDGLLFYINGDLQMEREYDVKEWKTVTFDLKNDHYTFAWIYRKTRAGTVGRDRVEISSIEVLGTYWAENECTKCPKGRAAPAGQHQCTPCAPGYAAPEEGMGECAKCDEKTQFSFQGAHKCVDRLACTDDDIQARHTLCADNKRVKYWEWLEPHLCSEQLPGAVSLKKNETVACAPCPPGKPRDESKGTFHCETCPAGSYSPGGATPCQTCGAGHAAVKNKYYQRWDEALDEMLTPCVDPPADCGSVWRLMDKYIDSGVATTEDTTEFDLVLDFYAWGSVTFNFTLVCSPTADYGGGCEASFYIDDYFRDSWDETYFLESLASTDNNPNKALTMTYNDIDPGQHKLRWRFNTRSFDDQFAQIRIHTIEVRGVSNGGAGECTKCAAGERANKDHTLCEKCPPGTFSKEGSDECTKCDANTCSSSPGSTECTPCGLGSRIMKVLYDYLSIVEWVCRWV